MEEDYNSKNGESILSETELLADNYVLFRVNDLRDVISPNTLGAASSLVTLSAAPITVQQPAPTTVQQPAPANGIHFGMFYTIYRLQFQENVNRSCYINENSLVLEATDDNLNVLTNIIMINEKGVNFNFELRSAYIFMVLIFNTSDLLNFPLNVLKELSVLNMYICDLSSYDFSLIPSFSSNRDFINANMDSLLNLLVENFFNTDNGADGKRCFISLLKLVLTILIYDNANLLISAALEDNRFGFPFFIKNPLLSKEDALIIYTGFLNEGLANAVDKSDEEEQSNFHGHRSDVLTMLAGMSQQPNIPHYLSNRQLCTNASLADGLSTCFNNNAAFVESNLQLYFKSDLALSFLSTQFFNRCRASPFGRICREHAKKNTDDFKTVMDIIVLVEDSIVDRPHWLQLECFQKTVFLLVRCLTSSKTVDLLTLAAEILSIKLDIPIVLEDFFPNHLLVSKTAASYIVEELSEHYAQPEAGLLAIFNDKIAKPFDSTYMQSAPGVLHSILDVYLNPPEPPEPLTPSKKSSRSTSFTPAKKSTPVKTSAKTSAKTASLELTVKTTDDFRKQILQSKGGSPAALFRKRASLEFNDYLKPAALFREEDTESNKTVRQCLQEISSESSVYDYLSRGMGADKNYLTFTFVLTEVKGIKEQFFAYSPTTPCDNSSIVKYNSHSNAFFVVCLSVILIVFKINGSKHHYYLIPELQAAITNNGIINIDLLLELAPKYPALENHIVFDNNRLFNASQVAYELILKTCPESTVDITNQIVAQTHFDMFFSKAFTLSKFFVANILWCTHLFHTYLDKVQRGIIQNKPFLFTGEDLLKKCIEVKELNVQSLKRKYEEMSEEAAEQKQRADFHAKRADFQTIRADHFEMGGQEMRKQFLQISQQANLTPALVNFAQDTANILQRFLASAPTDESATHHFQINN